MSPGELSKVEDYVIPLQARLAVVEDLLRDLGKGEPEADQSEVFWGAAHVVKDVRKSLNHMATALNPAEDMANA